MTLKEFLQLFAGAVTLVLAAFVILLFLNIQTPAADGVCTTVDEAKAQARVSGLELERYLPLLGYDGIEGVLVFVDSKTNYAVGFPVYMEGNYRCLGPYPLPLGKPDPRS